MRKLIRKGKCKRCGECCWGMAPDGTVDKCERLDWDTKLCTVWRTPLQLPMCRRYPNHPRVLSANLPYECGYRFYDAETGKEVTKRKRKKDDGDWESDWEELDSYEPLDEECD